MPEYGSSVVARNDEDHEAVSVVFWKLGGSRGPTLGLMSEKLGAVGAILVPPLSPSGVPKQRHVGQRNDRRHHQQMQKFNLFGLPFQSGWHWPTHGPDLLSLFTILRRTSGIAGNGKPCIIRINLHVGLLLQGYMGRDSGRAGDNKVIVTPDEPRTRPRPCKRQSQAFV